VASDELDRLIDDALAGYVNAEPRVGLETRILRRVEGGARRAWWRWVWAVPVLASFAAWMLVPPREERLELTARVVMPPAPAVTGARPRPVVRPARPAEPPKRPLFPTPAPLTAEEQALVTLAVQHPEALRQMASSNRSWTEPIHIEELKIEPLHIGN
jgi:hypothetical protein